MSDNGRDLFDRPSTADTGERNAHDLYETPAWMVASLLHFNPFPAGSRILEPCVGDGAIARLLRAAGYDVVTNDVDVRHAADFHHDATGPALWQEPALTDIDFVVSNLPFVIAFRILEQSWLLARCGVALLLRKTFTEPTEQRGPWLAAHPPSRIIGQPRHSFRGKVGKRVGRVRQTDSVSTDWHIWNKHATLIEAVSPFVIDHRAKERV